MTIPIGCIVSGMPQLIGSGENNGWNALKEAGRKLRQIDRAEGNTILLYSTQWFSILGSYIMWATPSQNGSIVDQEFHELGSMKYSFETDMDLANHYNEQARKRGLHCRLVSYKGFPVDTGSIVAIKLLNPDNRFKGWYHILQYVCGSCRTVVLGRLLQMLSRHPVEEWPP